MAGLAILMAALGPTISQGLRGDSVAGWAEVCSAQVGRAIKIDGAGGPVPAPDPGHSFEHCPYCSLHNGAGWIPTVSVAQLPLLLLSFELPRLLLAGSRSLFEWTVPQSRAPPVIS